MTLKFSLSFYLAGLSVASTLSTPIDGLQWTLKDMHRGCNNDNTRCDWDFGIFDANESNTTTSCTLTITQDNASGRNGAGSCEFYTLSSGYDHTEGFTVLYILNNKNSQHIWAGYEDAVLRDGQVVKPDREWAVYIPDAQDQ